MSSKTFYGCVGFGAGGLLAAAISGMAHVTDLDTGVFLWLALSVLGMLLGRAAA